MLPDNADGHALLILIDLMICFPKAINHKRCWTTMSAWIALPLFNKANTTSVATGLLKISPDFFSKKTQKNPDRENYFPSVLDDCCEWNINGKKNEIMPPYEKNPDFLEKYPETQTRPKNPDLVGKKPSGGNTEHNESYCGLCCVLFTTIARTSALIADCSHDKSSRLVFYCYCRCSAFLPASLFILIPLCSRHLGPLIIRGDSSAIDMNL